MACTNCQEVTPIPQCVEDITIGAIADLTTDVYVFVKNLTTGYLHQQEAVSDGAGLVILDSTLPDISFYNENHFYELWITKQSETINDKLPITVVGGATPFDCLLLVFTKTDLGGFTTHILSV